MNAADTTVNFGPLWDGLAPYIAAAMGSIILAIAGWLAVLLQRWTGVSIDTKHREALAAALTTGVNYGLAKAGTAANNLTFDVRSQIIADAIVWVEKSVPDAVKHFDMTPETVAKMVAAKLQVADPNLPSIPATPEVVK